jgi:hypothetical protein
MVFASRVSVTAHKDFKARAATSSHVVGAHNMVYVLQKANVYVIEGGRERIARKPLELFSCALTSAQVGAAVKSIRELVFVMLDSEVWIVAKESVRSIHKMVYHARDMEHVEKKIKHVVVSLDLRDQTVPNLFVIQIV